MPQVQLPRLYCIVDAGCFTGEPDRTAAIGRFTRELIAGGATLIQYRNKSGNAREMVSDAREMVRIIETFHGQRPTTDDQRPLLIMNDRADLCLVSGFDGAHVGQDDLSPEAVRRVVGNALWTGVSTHNPEQIATADKTSANYVAIGPVYATSSKQNPDPVIGLDGVRRARELTSKPLVAIGGIMRQNCRAVLDAGADSVAVIGDLLNNPQATVREFLQLLSQK